MIVTAVSVVLGGIACFSAGVATLLHWPEIVQWLKDCFYTFRKLVETTLKGIGKATRVFIQTMGEGIATIKHKLFYTEGDKIMVRETTREIRKEDLPDWAKAKLSVEETNITKEADELVMTL